MKNKMKIGITGGSGLIGKALRHNLDGSVRFVSRNSAEELLSLDEVLIVGNFADQNVINQFVTELDVLIHTAAAVGPRVEFDEDFIKNDLVGSINLAKAFFKANPQGHFIFLSTAGGLYNLQDPSIKTEESELFPDNIYGAVKLIVESALEGLGHISILRPAPVYGDSFKKNQKIGLIDKLLKSTLKDSEPVMIFDKLESARDYLHVNDLVDAIKSLMMSKKVSSYEVYNVGTGKETSIGEVIKLVESIDEKKVHVKILPIEGGRTSLIVNADKLFKATGWKPKISLREGIVKMSQGLATVKC